MLLLSLMTGEAGTGRLRASEVGCAALYRESGGVVVSGRGRQTRATMRAGEESLWQARRTSRGRTACEASPSLSLSPSLESRAPGQTDNAGLPIWRRRALGRMARESTECGPLRPRPLSPHSIGLWGELAATWRHPNAGRASKRISLSLHTFMSLAYASY